MVCVFIWRLQTASHCVILAGLNLPLSASAVLIYHLENMLTKITFNDHGESHLHQIVARDPGENPETFPPSMTITFLFKCSF